MQVYGGGEGSGQRLYSFREAKGLEFNPSGFQVVVDNDLVENTGLLCKLELVLGLGQTLGDGVLGVGGSATQALFENLERRGL